MLRPADRCSALRKTLGNQELTALGSLKPFRAGKSAAKGYPPYPDGCEGVLNYKKRESKPESRLQRTVFVGQTHHQRAAADTHCDTVEAEESGASVE